ncbi:MAG: hypothetical protein J5I90_04490 [Caldilineales bacterium]|nr:hypothetical protein [Caldilineales bacterium]
MSGLRVAVVANIKHNILAEIDAPDDALAEYDSLPTVQALVEALKDAGHSAYILEADETLLDTVRVRTPDICFNIAEGLRGDSRESHVPALLEMLGVRYTGGKVLCHAISLDKGVTKQLWRDSGLPTAPFQVFHRASDPLDPELTFPLFVKPVREGSGMGINENSIVHSLRDLRAQVQWVLDNYHQPALVEDYLPGREFTVGVIGNTLTNGQTRGPLYNDLGFHTFPVLEVDTSVGESEGLYNALAKSFLPGEEGAPLYLCPADIEPAFATELKHLAIKAFEAVGALDVARVDFKLGRYGRPYLLEINTLPGLNPAASDMCIVSRAEGISYQTLINEILNLALERYGLLQPMAMAV